MSAPHRSVPSCDGSRYPFVTPSCLASLPTNRTARPLHAVSIAACTAAPATLEAMAVPTEFVLPSDAESSPARAVSTAPVVVHCRLSWMPHLIRVFPASMARMVSDTNQPEMVSDTIHLARSVISAEARGMV